MISPQPSTSGATLPRIREDSPKAATSDRESVEGPTTLVDKYELVGAVPTRIMKPSSAESSFTCYAFSAAGDRFVTGETDGTTKLWKTSSYELIGTCSASGGVPISAVSFLEEENERVVSIDRAGTVQVLRFDLPRQISAFTIPQAAVLNLGEIECEEPESNLSNFLRNQFSKDGTILAHFRGVNDQEMNIFTFTKAEIYRIGENLDKHPRVWIPGQSDVLEFSVPVLSKNGRSLLICSCQGGEESVFTVARESTCQTAIKVIPRIFNGSRTLKTVSLEGQHASWGLDGEYLLVWTWNNKTPKKPRLLIYRTEDIERKRQAVKPFAKKTLDLGLFDYKAQVLRPLAGGEETVRVLIYEVTEHEKKRLRRFLIWDTKHGTVANEVQMSMHQVKGIDKRRWTMGRSTMLKSSVSRRIDGRLPESTFLTRSAETLYYRMVADAFPKFCASRDNNWIGAFSWTHQSGGISSVATEVTAWTFRLPENVKMDPLLLPNHVSFDPRENHFMIFAEGGIFACHPDFLRLTGASAMRMGTVQPLTDDSNQIDVEDVDLLKQWTVLPSAALAKKQTMKLERIQRKQSLSRSKQDQNVFKRIVDVSQSADGCLTALIAEDKHEKQPTILSISEIGQEIQLGQGCHLRFPMELPMSEEPFNPARVFLFGKAAHGDGRVALLSDGEKPVVIFATHDLKELVPVCLDINKCLDVCMTEDRMQLIILDVWGVCFLNLKQQKITQRIAYKVDFDAIMTMLPEDILWGRNGDNSEELRSERRISDNGRRVLLGWDTKNKRSITVKPTTEQRDCEESIQKADRELSDFCTLSASGTSTSFLDVDDLMNGKITVGIFNERVGKIVLHFHVAENLPFSLSEEQKIKLLSSVFYGMSEDERELITVTVGLQQALPHSWRVEEKVRAFNIYGAGDCIPSYDRLTLKRLPSIENTFRKLHDEHGVSAFNAPSSDGLTIFQKAFLQGNKEVVESIKKFAKEHEVLLAVEWISSDPGARPCNLLDEALKTMSPAVVKEAVELISSPLVPFRSAARIMKKHFDELVAKHLDVVEEAFRNNLLVTRVCEVDVHTKFMDQNRRKDSAIYMGTKDLFLDWKLRKDKEAAKEKWRRENKFTVESMESDGNKSTTPAILTFVRIQDAVKTGMDGILRPLLLGKVPVCFFEFDVVKWVVLFKWFTIWRQRFLWQLAWYMAFLACFASYAIMLARTDNLSATSERRKIWLSCFLGATVPFCLKMLIEEFQQLGTYIKDGEKHQQANTDTEVGRKKWRFVGLAYYLKHEWNMMDLGSCILVLGIIAPLHISALAHKNVEDWLSAFVAIESIVAFAKVWYFAQPFQHTGPLVRMIYSIMWESAIFLGLAFEVMLGFGVGLPTLFRNPTPDDAGHDGAEDGNEAVEDAFGHFHFSLYTLFFALVGNFDAEVYRSAGNLSWLATLIFIVYLLVQMILLLNLLISIMGDTFARVKGTEEAHLLMGRAKFIDACEADLGEAGCKKIDEDIEKYLHVLTEVQAVSKYSPAPESLEGDGRVDSSISNDHILATIHDHHANVSDIKNQLKTLQAFLTKGTDKDGDEKGFYSPGRLDEMEDKLSAMENTLTFTSSRIDDVVASTSERIDEILDLVKKIARSSAIED